LDKYLNFTKGITLSKSGTALQYDKSYVTSKNRCDDRHVSYAYNTEQCGIFIFFSVCSTYFG
jgi:hypothetical protein